MTSLHAKSILLILLIFLGISSGMTQHRGTHAFPGIALTRSYGFLIRHHLDMGRYTNIRFPALELSAYRETDGHQTWHHDHHFPVQGLSLFYSGLGHTPELGDVVALIPWLKIPVYRSGLKAVQFKFGTGLGYFHKKFDVLENYKNRAIGSHINACIQFGLVAQYPLFRNLLLNGGFQWTHFSNGSVRIPNYGINMPAFVAGLSFQPFPSTGKTDSPMKARKPRYPALLVSYIHGVKQVLPLNGPLYQVSVGSATFLWPIRRNGSIRSGLDLSVDRSDKALLRQEGIEVRTAVDLLKTGIFGGISSRFGRTSVFFDAGVYLSGRETSDGAIYDRLGLQVELTSGFHCQVYLKSHYAKADFIGWGISYSLKEFRR